MRQVKVRRKRTMISIWQRVIDIFAYPPIHIIRMSRSSWLTPAEAMDHPAIHWGRNAEDCGIQDRVVGAPDCLEPALGEGQVD